MFIRDGFPGQSLRTLPRPLISSALSAEPTARLLVTDVGYFPSAESHGRIRPHGAEQAIVILCTEGAGWARISLAVTDDTLEVGLGRLQDALNRG